MLKLIGYWHEAGRTDPWPHPRILVDRRWEEKNRSAIVGYLKGGLVTAAYAGFSTCRFLDCPLGMNADRVIVGTTEQTDGVWIWPEGLAHYVEHHFVRLPDELIEDAKKNGFRVPALGDLRITPQDVDGRFCAEWCQRHAAPPTRREDLAEIGRLLDHRNDNVRERAVGALEAFGPDALPLLLRALEVQGGAGCGVP